MQILKSALMLATVAVGMVPFSSAPVLALPLSPAAGGEEFAASGPALATIEVRNNGAGVAAGIIGGMILGGIISSQPHYYYPPRYSPRYSPYYSPYAYYPAYRPYPMEGAAIAYCSQRFKSYDPYRMTYLGYDGLRHSCP
jgi:hypothetical protein